jgi:hypothetical protein
MFEYSCGRGCTVPFIFSRPCVLVQGIQTEVTLEQNTPIAGLCESISRHVCQWHDVNTGISMEPIRSDFFHPVRHG